MDAPNTALASGSQPARETTFNRSAARQAMEGGGAAIGGILFLGMAVLFLVGILPAPLPFRIIGVAIFGFFGLLMGAGSVASMQRGRDSRIAVVTPQHLWLPDLGELAWSAMADVRVEHVRTVGGPRNTQIQEYRRLGIVPSDPSLKPRGAAALAERLTNAYFNLVRTLQPATALGNKDAAPFGVSELDTGAADFDRLLALVRGYHPVTEPA